MNARTDTELVAQHRAGDPGAFAELSRRHVNWVYSAARRRTGDDHLAEDVTQAVFILVAQKPPKRWTLPSLSPWLFGVMIRTCKAALRARETRRRHETEAAKMRSASTQPPPHADWSEIAPHLEEMVQKLRHSDREIVLLRFYEQKSFTEIAELTGITEEAARKRVSRAIEALRGMLSRRGVSMPAAALGALLAVKTTEAAPLALAAKATAGAAVGFTSIRGLALALRMKMNITAVLALAAVVAVLGFSIHLLLADPPRSPAAAASAPSTTAAIEPWRTRFNEVYTLREGEVLKNIRQPFIPEREMYFRLTARQTGPGFDSAIFSYRGELWLRGGGSGLSTVKGIMQDVLAMRPYEFELPEELGQLPMTGDWIGRYYPSQDNSTRAGELAALCGIIAEIHGVAYRFREDKSDRMVIHASGRYQFRPLTGVADTEHVHFYVDQVDEPDPGALELNPFHAQLASLGVAVGMPTVDDTSGTPRSFPGVWHRSARQLWGMPAGEARDEKLRKLFDAISMQTALTVQLKKEPFTVWVADKAQTTP